MMTTFIHSVVTIENHTRFQTKMGKVYIRFQTKTAQEPYPMALYKVVPPRAKKLASCFAALEINVLNCDAYPVLPAPTFEPVLQHIIFNNTSPKAKLILFNNIK